MAEETKMSEEQTPDTPAEEQTPNQPVSWVNDDGSFNRDKFGDELGRHTIFDKYPNVEEFVKGSINAQTMIGQKIDDWIGSDNEDIIKQRMNLAGVPSDPDGYEVQYPDSFADIEQDNQNAIKEYIADTAKWAHENGVPKDVFEKFVARDLEKSIQVHLDQKTNEDQEYQKELGALQKEWGNEFENNKSRAENMAKMLGMEGIIPVLEDNPEIMKEFYDGASKLMNDDTIIEAKQTQSLETARDMIDDLSAKMLNYKGSTSDPEYIRMIEKMSKLQRGLPKKSDDISILS
jgi:hypothetical protein